MGGFGPTTPELVVIGEAPAAVEDRWCQICQRPATTKCIQLSHAIGQPFTGQSGQLLRKALKEAGFLEDHVRFTNAVRCSAGGAVNPTMTELRRCSLYLTEELQSLDYSQCKGVVLLGQSAVRGVLDRGNLSIKEARGRELSPFLPFKLPVRVTSTYHPAAALPHRSPQLYDEIVKDLKNIHHAKDAIRSVEWITDPAELGHLEVVGLDLEWHPSTGKIRMVGLATNTRNVVIKSPRKVLPWLSNHGA